MVETREYGIAELADLGGVSRRTVRYYVQEGLLPAPLGVGRGRHYGPAHLERLLRVKALQEEGRSLTEIRAILAGPRNGGRGPRPPTAPARSPWTRLEVAPGVELHVAGGVRIPPPGKLAELTDWCRRVFRREEGADAATDE